MRRDGPALLRWRPLLDGPLFGAFGPYGMDGSRTDRSEMASKVGKWVSAPEQETLWQSRPVKGEIGIVYVPETQLFTYAQQGSTDFYAQSMQGAYQGFFDLNIQADWVHIDHIDEYDLLYLPFPVMLNQATADKLRDWVAAGGTLVAEGCPGYSATARTSARSSPTWGWTSSLAPGELRRVYARPAGRPAQFNLAARRCWGGIFLQAYEPTTGTAVGWYEDGRVAAVENQYGKGRTRLIGTMAGYGHGLPCTRRLSPLLQGSAGLRRPGTARGCSDPHVKARIHDGDGGRYLWVANPTRQERPVRLQLGSAWGPFSSGRRCGGRMLM